MNSGALKSMKVLIKVISIGTISFKGNITEILDDHLCDKLWGPVESTHRSIGLMIRRGFGREVGRGR